MTRCNAWQISTYLNPINTVASVFLCLRMCDARGSSNGREGAFAGFGHSPVYARPANPNNPHLQRKTNKEIDIEQKEGRSARGSCSALTLSACLLIASSQSAPRSSRIRGRPLRDPALHRPCPTRRSLLLNALPTLPGARPLAPPGLLRLG